MSDLIHLGGGATPRPKENPGVILNAKGAPKITSNSKFKELIKKFEALGKMDINDFNTVSEMTAFLDFYNATRKEAQDSRFNNEVVEISKFLARIQTQKTIFLNDKK